MLMVSLDEQKMKSFGRALDWHAQQSLIPLKKSEPERERQVDGGREGGRKYWVEIHCCIH
jgi:hypothetical protein